MENLQLIGLSQQMALRRQLDVVANNVANMNTTAFKGESTVFEEHLVRTMSADKTARKIAFVRDIATVRDVTEGRIEQTGGPLDLAIAGDGYFAVSTAGKAMKSTIVRPLSFFFGAASPSGAVPSAWASPLSLSSGSSLPLPLAFLSPAIHGLSYMVGARRPFGVPAHSLNYEA